MLLKVVCIPVFNEERIIRKIVQDCTKYVDRVVVCDDGSSDKTFEEAQLGGAIVLKHPQNMGKGAALKTLFKYARDLNPDVVVTIDGDGQFLPQEIEKILKPVLQGDADIVIGYRFDEKTEMPSYRKIGNKFLDKITNMASELPFRDTQSGFRAYSKKAIESIRFSANGFGADSEILLDAAKKGLKISEEKVTVIYNTGFETSTKNPISHSSDVIGSLIELVALRHPLKYLGIPGLIFTIIGIAYSIEVISLFNTLRYFSIPSTLVTLGCLMIGVLLLLMSVVLFSIGRATRKY